jgi:hypothetical protein
MTLMLGLQHFFLEMSKNCWPRFRVRNSTCLGNLTSPELYELLLHLAGNKQYVSRWGEVD